MIKNKNQKYFLLGGGSMFLLVSLNQALNEKFTLLFAIAGLYIALYLKLKIDKSSMLVFSRFLVSLYSFLLLIGSLFILYKHYSVGVMFFTLLINFFWYYLLLLYCNFFKKFSILNKISIFIL